MSIKYVIEFFQSCVGDGACNNLFASLINLSLSSTCIFLTWALTLQK
jgi:hypothetical protein